MNPMPSGGVQATCGCGRQGASQPLDEVFGVPVPCEMVFGRAQINLLAFLKGIRTSGSLQNPGKSTTPEGSWSTASDTNANVAMQITCCQVDGDSGHIFFFFW